MSVTLQQPSTEELLAAALRPGALQPAFQPIVDLQTGAVLALEALARWPGVPGADPATVFTTAERQGWTAQLDWACRTAALDAALAHQLDPRIALFINVETATLGQEIPPTHQEVVDRASGRLRVVLELTERELMNDPAELLRLVRWARDRGWGIAMDDVGANPASLALLPFVAPDVVKLDLQLIQGNHAADQARTMLGVAAYVEETGATLVAEGIETERHREQALALGARYGQGWLLGRPGPITVPQRTATLPPPVSAGSVVPSPFDLVRSSPHMRRGRKRLLLDMTRALERRAATSDESVILLSAFQYAENFTVGTARRYRAMARTLPLVAALAAGLSAQPANGVRGADLATDDPLTGEWTVAVIGPHYAAALIARDCGDGGPDHDRRFDFVLTHNRESVLSAGRSLLDRVTSQQLLPPPVAGLY